MQFGRMGRGFGRLGARGGGGPHMVIPNGVLSIEENTANSTELGTVTISGTYTGTPSFSVTDASGVLAIDSGTGVVTVLDNTNLDFETFPTLDDVVFSVSGTTPAVPDRTIDILVTDVAEGSDDDDYAAWMLTAA